MRGAVERGLRNSPAPFEAWPLHRVGKVVAAGQMPTDPLVVLLAAIAETRGQDAKERHTLALMDLAECIHLSLDRLQELPEALPPQPTTARERHFVRFVEA